MRVCRNKMSTQLMLNMNFWLPNQEWSKARDDEAWSNEDNEVMLHASCDDEVRMKEVTDEV